MKQRGQEWRKEVTKACTSVAVWECSDRNWTHELLSDFVSDLVSAEYVLPVFC